MAGPLNGIGGQQIPLATTFQPGQQVRSQQDDRSSKTNQTKSQDNTQQVQGQPDTKDRDPRQLQSLLKSADSSDKSDGRRGGVVDITV